MLGVEQECHAWQCAETKPGVSIRYGHSSPVSAVTALGVADVCCHAWLFMWGVGDLNLGLHACIASFE